MMNWIFKILVPQNETTSGFRCKIKSRLNASLNAIFLDFKLVLKLAVTYFQGKHSFN